MSGPRKPGGGKGKGPVAPLAMPTHGGVQVRKVEEGEEAAADVMKLDQALAHHANGDLRIEHFEYVEVGSGRTCTDSAKALLGEGSYAKVYKMRKKGDPVCVAVKIMQKNKFFMTEELKKGCVTTDELNLARKRLAKARSRLLIEIAIMQELSIERNQNLPSYIATFHDTQCIYVVMELAEGTELFSFLDRTSHSRHGTVPLLPLRDLAILGQQLLTTIQFIHKEGIIHRDIKLENIMIKPIAGQKRFIIKLIDFGQAKYTKQRSDPRRHVFDPAVSPGPGATPGTLSPVGSPAISVTPSCGSAMYLPVEALSKMVDKEEWHCPLKHAPKIDIYACGMIMFIVLCGPPTDILKLVDAEANETGEKKAERHQQLMKVVKGDYLMKALDAVKGEEAEMARLVKEMLSLEPGMRPSTEECLKRIQRICPSLMDDREQIPSVSLVTSVAAVACCVLYDAVAPQEKGWGARTGEGPPPVSWNQMTLLNNPSSSGGAPPSAATPPPVPGVPRQPNFDALGSNPFMNMPLPSGQPPDNVYMNHHHHHHHHQHQHPPQNHQHYHHHQHQHQHQHQQFHQQQHHQQQHHQQQHHQQQHHQQQHHQQQHHQPPQPYYTPPTHQPYGAPPPSQSGMMPADRWGSGPSDAPPPNLVPPAQGGYSPYDPYPQGGYAQPPAYMAPYGQGHGPDQGQPGQAGINASSGWLAWMRDNDERT